MSVLTAEAIGKSYGGNRVLHDVQLELASGEAVGLIGPNGAGKSTMLNILSGLIAPTMGTVRFDSQDVTRVAAHRRARLGLGRTFQHAEMFTDLSVLENVLVAVELTTVTGLRTVAETFVPFLGRRRLSLDIERAGEALDVVGLGSYAHREVAALPGGMSKLLAVARALVCRPRLVLLDEPSAGLTDLESRHLERVLGRIVEEGTGLLIVEHDVGLVTRLCSRIYVLDFGEMIAAGPPSSIMQDEKVRAAYLGSEALQ